MVWRVAATTLAQKSQCHPQARFETAGLKAVINMVFVAHHLFLCVPWACFRLHHCYTIPVSWAWPGSGRTPLLLTVPFNLLRRRQEKCSNRMLIEDHQAPDIRCKVSRCSHGFCWCRGCSLLHALRITASSVLGGHFLQKPTYYNRETELLQPGCL